MVRDGLWGNRGLAREAKVAGQISEQKTLPERGSEAARLACLKALERKLLWLSSWTIHNANHLRPSRDGLKVGGHQASSASLVTLMTALYFSMLRPQDRVAVKPHASPVFHAIQYLLGNQSRKSWRLSGLWRCPVLSLADQGQRRCRLLHRLGRPWGRHDLLRQPGSGLRRLKGWLGADSRGPDGRPGRRCRARRGQRLRGPAGGLEARSAERLVDHRLQPTKPGCRRLGPPLRALRPASSIPWAGGS